MKFPALFTTLAVCLAIAPSSFAQGTAFSYQGRLSQGGAPANGRYDLAFTLYNTNTTGAAMAGPVLNSAVAVTDGLFTTAVDFGPGVFTGGSNWLAIEVSTNGANSFTTLAPRQQLTPVPYALFAAGANAAGLSGTIPVAQLPGSVANLSANQTFTGMNQFAGLLARGGPGPFGVNNNGYAFSGNGGDNDSGMYSTNDGVLQFYNNNIEAMRIVNSRVGIGTATPASPLQVVGNIQMGSGGANYAASGPENLLIVRGIITPDGTINQGSGFTCTSNNVGRYTLTFTGFSAFPAVTFSGASCIATWNGISGSPGNINVGVSVVNYAGTFVNQYFSFIAVGSR